MMDSKRLYAIGALLAVVAVLTFLGMSGEDGEGRVGVSGTITSNGTSLESGRIHFLPDASTTGSDVWGTIEGGRYRIRRADGPVPGTYSVTIEVGSLPSKQGTIDTIKKGRKPVEMRTVSWPEPVVIGADETERQLDLELPH